MAKQNLDLREKMEKHIDNVKWSIGMLKKDVQKLGAENAEIDLNDMDSIIKYKKNCLEMITLLDNMINETSSLHELEKIVNED